EVEKNNKNLLLVEDSNASFALTNIYQDRIEISKKKTTKHGILSQSIEFQEQGRNGKIWSNA
ncbi:5262_t:CDS:1, partial [Gigaspora margarita]